MKLFNKYFKMFLPFLGLVFMAIDGDGGEGGEGDYLSELDNLLNPPKGEEHNHGEGNEGKPPEGDPQDPEGKGKKNNLEERYKQLQEHARQQQKTISELQKNQEKYQSYFDAITGIKTEKDKQRQELDEQKAWQEDTPTMAKKLIEEETKKVKDELKKELITQKITAEMDKTYREIEQEYDVDMDKVAPELLPVLGLFSKDALRKAPKKTILGALKIIDKLKPRDEKSLYYVEGSGSGGNGTTSKTALQKEAERIRAGIDKAGKPLDQFDF